MALFHQVKIHIRFTVVYAVKIIFLLIINNKGHELAKKKLFLTVRNLEQDQTHIT